MQRDKDFYLFQLRLRGLKDCIRLPEADHEDIYEEQVSLNQELFTAFTQQHYEPDFTSVFTRKGFYGYDETIVFTPHAARWMLDNMQAMQDIDEDLKLMRHRDIPKQQLSVYLSRFNIDSYLCWDFRRIAEAAIEEGKGLYCPRFAGYNFIEDDIPMGSLTHWVSTDRPDAPEINKRSRLKYIN